MHSTQHNGLRYHNEQAGAGAEQWANVTGDCVTVDASSRYQTVVLSGLFYFDTMSVDESEETTPFSLEQLE